MTTSDGLPDPALVDLVIARSWETLVWMHSKGVEFELAADKLVDPDKQADTKVGLTPGGAIRAYHEGVGLIERLFAAVEKAGIEVWYEAPAARLITDGSTVKGVVVRRASEFVEVRGNVVLASGGFEANPEMRRRYLGHGWDLVKVRGTRFNMGTMLSQALLSGAQPTGHWGGAHAVPLDLLAPPVGDLKMTDKYSRYSYPYALLVNTKGERFVDEGEAQVFMTYAKTGWAIRAQDRARAYQIFDQRTIHLLEPRYSTGTPVTADTLDELAGKLGVDAAGLAETVATYNAAVASDAPDRFDPFNLDGVTARPTGQPVKSNWALPVDSGPYVAYAVGCGITFTYGGLRVDLDARVLSTEGEPMDGLYATGEVAGGFFFHNYSAGAGLMRGAVFGKIAGTNAAARALSTTKEQA
jgi:tricarballylate dehydrogenase